MAPPIFTPFFFHWYPGIDPPLVGVAVNVTDVPEQIVVPGAAAIVTDGTKTGLTVIVIALLVEAFGTAQEALLVITTVITSLLFNALVVKELPV